MLRPPTVRVLLLVLAACSLLGVLAAVRMSIAYAALGHPIPFGDALGSGLADWLLWAPLVPAMVALARRFPIGGNSWVVPLAVHASGGVAFSLAQLAAFAAWSS